MKSVKVFFCLTMIMALVITASKAFSFNEPNENPTLSFPKFDKFLPQIPSYHHQQQQPSIISQVGSGKGRMHATLPLSWKDRETVYEIQIPSYHHKLKITESTRITCNINPIICWAKGSLGPFCCNKKCVNVLNDKENCGFCGKNCKYNETCCKGQCVNTLFHKRHCGSCNNKCKSDSSCAYGMCSYAN
uniref:Uncharacterized protein LOC104216261 n=1 Tax=Nicotiana sylvestris TaxID=4096 RepID=A0A1U7VI48_NICSY|nr:PREDICTED: uncharacterized protein LOC104216261 [Nicotiana sylvestris]